MTRRIIVGVAAALALHGCASYKPVPDGYTGPVAVVADSGQREDATKAQVFALMEVDGNSIDNSFAASARASQGQGFALTTRFVSRQVPATPMKVKIKASHATGAPIQQLFGQAAGSFLSVEGVTDFTPAPGGNYVVKGELSKGGSSVWIEDAATNQPVTQKVTAK
jgi:hypothetical protein